NRAVCRAPRVACRILVHHADGPTAPLRCPAAGVAVHGSAPRRIGLVADRRTGPSGSGAGADDPLRLQRNPIRDRHERRVTHVESIDRATDIESRRMELRGVVRLSGEVIAQYWPMRTFVHHNPLHSLEYLPFEETVRRGKQFMGGSGYLSSEVYRHYLRSGRIRPEHLDAVLGPLAQPTGVAVATRTITHGEILRACLTEGLGTPAVEPLDSQLPDPSRVSIERLTA